MQRKIMFLLSELLPRELSVAPNRPLTLAAPRRRGARECVPHALPMRRASSVITFADTAVFFVAVTPPPSGWGLRLEIGPVGKLGVGD
ncbi:unnamed protein product [Linum trigynum]|uniref:Uncharacterized protein n=1 Tax=Linum trigynum TaxID=586398 RepID=A0AAV2FCB3_9ROSI